jgi:DNA-binding protein H-NS
MPSLEQIQLKIAKLQAQAEAIATKKASVVLNQIASLMRQHNLTTAHIETHLATRKPRGRPAKSTLDSAASGAPKKRGRPAKSAGATVKKSILPPKYRDPETGQTWSGHARPPAWIKDAADRSVYLIAGAGAAAGKSAAKKASTGKTAGRKAGAKVAKRASGPRVARKAASNGASSKTSLRKPRRSAASKRAAAVEASA